MAVKKQKVSKNSSPLSFELIKILKVKKQKQF
jgi:hypothetical protein